MGKMSSDFVCNYMSKGLTETAGQGSGASSDDVGKSTHVHAKKMEADTSERTASGHL